MEFGCVSLSQVHCLRPMCRARTSGKKEEEEEEEEEEEGWW